VYLYEIRKEDSLTLYGFSLKEERNLFISLLSVSGVGPKTGISFFSDGNCQLLVKAINDEDIGFLTKYPGIGKKTASQIILDLKGHLTIPVVDTNVADAIAALVALGYNKLEAAKAVSKHPEYKNLEDLIKLSLRGLEIERK
jgi:Holliday junction DNA helicase RuvA